MDLQPFLSQVTPLNTLASNDIAALAAAATEHTYARGETIYNEGDAAEGVWVLRQGEVQIVKYSPQGKPFVIELLRPGEIFGTLCRLGDMRAPYPCTAVSTTDSAAVCIADATFKDVAGRHPSLMAGFCSLCSQRLRAAHDMACTIQDPVDRRIARVLLQLREFHGDELPFTKREIAELAGTTVETAIRTTSLFAKRGWLGLSRGKISIKNGDALDRFMTPVMETRKA